MSCSEELNSVINHRIGKKNIEYLSIDCFSCRSCVSSRDACNETDVIIDERLAAQCELAAVCLQFSGWQLSILEYVMLQLSIFWNLFELANRSGDVIVVMCFKVFQTAFLCELIKSYGCFSVTFLICFLDCVIEDCQGNAAVGYRTLSALPC